MIERGRASPAPQRDRDVPYWRLSAYYFAYFATLGALVPYWGLYLQSLGFEAVAIGQLMALLLATKIVAPNVWSWIADHSHHYMGVVRLAGLLSLVCYLGVFFGTTFWWMALVTASFSFFWNASLPQMEVTTLNYLGPRGARYGRIRVWGSFGFIVLVLALGPFVDAYGPGFVTPVIAVLLFGIFASTLAIPQAARLAAVGDQGSIGTVLRQPTVLAFLLTCFLMQASHAPFYTFYSIYLADHGYSKTLIGVLWAFGVTCEIAVFALTHRLFQHLSLTAVLAASFATTAVRWVLVAALPEYVGVMFLTQAMHAITFGAYHAAAIQLIHRFFHGAHQHRGQALYSSVSFGMGGAAGSVLGGYVWTAFGPVSTFLAASMLACVALVVNQWLVRPSVAARAVV